MNSKSTSPLNMVEGYFATFQEVTNLAKRSLAESQYEQSAAYAQVAAHYAWFNPTGVLASEELENILTQIGHALKSRRDSAVSVAQMPPQKVLHVITEAYRLGGHTRLIWRWIRADRKRNHSVALTGQGQFEVPSTLRTEVEATGGKIILLDRDPGGILVRALALRQLASQYDHVVLHTYPYDVIPVIAFSERQQRPPLTLMNKDDHVFWLGGSVIDQAAQMRDSGRRLCQERRGLSESQCPLLPIPLEVKQRTRKRGEAKKQLGLSEDLIVMLSVATAYKYSHTLGEHFAEILLKVLQEHQNVVLLVIGPEEHGEWAVSCKKAGGRLKVLGKRQDIDLFYEAADIYLDSFPFSSLTSILEAGSFGTPVVTYRLHPDTAAILCADDPALSALLIRACNVDDYRLQISRLIENDELRVSLGESTKESIVACHGEGGWNRYLEALYHRQQPQIRKLASSDFQTHRGVTELDLRLAQVFATAGLSRNLEQVFRYHVGLFPFRSRIGIWWKMFGHSWRSLPGFLLSDWQKTKLRLLWSRYDKETNTN